MEVTIQIADELIVHALDSADIGYWVGQVTKRANNADVVAGRDWATLSTDDDRQNLIRMDAEAVKRGLKVMAEKYPRHLDNVLQDNSDAETGDVLIQCAILGDIVYG